MLNVAQIIQVDSLEAVYVCDLFTETKYAKQNETHYEKKNSPFTMASRP